MDTDWSAIVDGCQDCKKFGLGDSEAEMSESSASSIFELPLTIERVDWLTLMTEPEAPAPLNLKLLKETAQDLELFLTVERNVRSGKHFDVVLLLIARLQRILRRSYGVPDILPLYAPQRKSIKVPMPDCTGYNYIGRLVGPRGISIKQLEKSTNCSILVRGKGSIKNALREAELLRSNHPGFRHLHEPLHVLISTEGNTEAECDSRLATCRDRIEDLLKPKNDNLRRYQLAHFAMLNGTYEDSEGNSISTPPSINGDI